MAALPFWHSQLESLLDALRPALRTPEHGRMEEDYSIVTVRELVAEVTQITEKVDNALKVTEDVYLARVYTTALELFRIRYWAGSIDRKLSLMRDVYTALYDEAVATRAEWLEASIVFLIVLEIELAFLLG